MSQHPKNTLSPKDDDHPLHRAAEDGDIGQLKKLLSADTPPDINGLDMAGDTPLDCAVLWGRKEAVAFLANRGGLSALEILAKQPESERLFPQLRDQGILSHQTLRQNYKDTQDTAFIRIAREGDFMDLMMHLRKTNQPMPSLQDFLHQGQRGQTVINILYSQNALEDLLTAEHWAVDLQTLKDIGAALPESYRKSILPIQNYVTAAAKKSKSLTQIRRTANKPRLKKYKP